MTAKGPLEGRRILLVEDSYPQAMDTSEWLIEAGAEVVGPASNAEKAHALLAIHKVDAAVLDVNLGSGPEYEIAASLAELGVPIVLATGYDKSAIDARFTNVPHVTKPISKQHLLRAILKLV